ncbi:hypothetical protein [Photobacterium damselae]|uniref:hypothetical protein n=1 Tax=Photobacterium damselae TaxID=38293 RepID=UPI001F25A472|nr:hypothetical protein [Photobacterium damselae]UKA31904.1 hypothetical protein IPQ37_21295 [Photobacterium damselae subsp. damselae]
MEFYSLCGGVLQFESSDYLFKISLPEELFLASPDILHEEFEEEMHQHNIVPPKDHDEEIALIYKYLINKFGDTLTAAFKLHEVLISLAYIAKRDGR